MKKYNKNAEEKLKITILKNSINYNLDKLGFNSEWLRLSTHLLSLGFFKKEYPKQDLRDVENLAGKIRKTLQDEKRKNLEFLEKLDNILTEMINEKGVINTEIPNDFGGSSNDDISKLCRKYLNNFLNKDFLIPNKELNAISYSAEKGHKLALRTMGDYYYYGGKFNIPNFIEAHRYYTLAVEQECYISAYQLATMYENENGFFDHKQIAYKYYEKSMEFYLIELAKSIKRDAPPLFPNVFKKVAYYLGFIKENIDHQGFLAISYLGFVHNDFICSLYFAYALYVGKGIEQNISSAIRIYEELVDDHKGSKGYLYRCLMSRLAIIYRDITDEKDKYETLKNKIKEKFYPETTSDKEIVFNIECQAEMLHPTQIHDFLQNSTYDIWNTNKTFNAGMYKDINSDIWEVKRTIFLR